VGCSHQHVIRRIWRLRVRESPQEVMKWNYIAQVSRCGTDIVINLSYRMELFTFHGRQMDKLVQLPLPHLQWCVDEERDNVHYFQQPTELWITSLKTAMNNKPQHLLTEISVMVHIKGSERWDNIEWDLRFSLQWTCLCWPSGLKRRVDLYVFP
jgi:hypothetical protein